ncbi:MAG TPA: cation:proton antiporter [Phycisphaerae bacterium]|nr:cation:proton antiporter [Phycisphaerae bacterium]
MDMWAALLDVLILLFAALLLGTLCERLKQSAILGYLLAGTLLGPNALDWMPSHRAVATIAELGATLLLFTIGLEFSWRRLRNIGPIALGGGTLQVVITGAVVAGACIALGVDTRASLVLGAMAALSSTACVVRLLVARAEIDSIHGRHALGILLLQDIAVVPLVLFITLLGDGGSGGAIGWEAGRAVAVAVAATGAMYLLLKYAMPRLITATELARNRELPILLAIATALGAAWIAHRVGVSPMLGSFIAGLLLAESPFAVQIRADVSSLRTLFVTLFFSSIGMVADPVWVFDHVSLVLAAVAAVVLCKAAVVFGVARLFRSRPGQAAATAVCLAQVGEFSFVLAEIARERGLIDGGLFKLGISATVATLFLTPYLVRWAPRIAVAVSRLSAPGRRAPLASDRAATHPQADLIGHVVIVGFGPAARRVAEAMQPLHASRLVVVELNSRTAATARDFGLRAYVGDATRTEILEHVSVQTAACVVVTIPDPTTARQVVERVRSLSPQTPIIARARYHVHRHDLIRSGAAVAVDEEDEVGLRLASVVLEMSGAMESPRGPTENGDPDRAST